jgi:anti-sigma factor RsiW
MSSADVKHPSDRSLIAFNSGALDDTRAGAVHRHLKDCQPCRRRLVGLSGEVVQVPSQAPVPDPEPVPAPIEFIPLPDRPKVPWLIVGVVAAVNVVVLSLIAAWAAGAFGSKGHDQTPVLAKADVATGLQPRENTASATPPAADSVTPPATQPAVNEQPAASEQGEPPKSESTPAPGDTAQSDKPAADSPPAPDGTNADSAKPAPSVTGTSPAQPDTPASAPPVAAKPAGAAKNGLAEFFNGKDLAGWQGQDKVWRVEQKTIVGVFSSGHTQSASLFSQRTYRDFDLRFEASVDESVGDCGVHFRSQVVDAEQHAVAGPYCPIYGKDAPNGQLTGSLITEPPPKVVRKASGKLAGRFVKPGLNHFHIRCQGKHILIEVNGAKVINAEFPALPDEGVIAWTLNAERPPHKATFNITRFTDLADAPTRAAPDQPALAETELLKAEIQFEKAMKTADEVLLKQFDQEIEKLHHQGHGGNGDMVATVEHEKEVFQEKGLIPWSRPMRKSLLQYCKEFMTARKTVGNAFDHAIERAEKSHNEAKKEALLAEAARVLAPRVVATWQTFNNGQNIRDVYYSDGTYVRNDHQDEGISRLWTLSGDDALTIEFPDDKNPANTMAWAFELSQNGKQLIGQRKNGSKFFWERVED